MQPNQGISFSRTPSVNDWSPRTLIKNLGVKH